MKVFKNATLTGYDGQPVKISQITDGKTEIVEVKLVNILWLILNNAPIQIQNDSIQGSRLALALDKSTKDGVDIELEEGIHDWLKPIAEKVTPTIFRVNGNIVYKHICEGFEK